MQEKEIKNIVFYKYFGQKVATIFYHDGSEKTVSYDEGISITSKIARVNNIKNKDAFRELINQKIVHVVTAEEFVKNHDKYLGTDKKVEDQIEESIDERFEALEEDHDQDNNIQHEQEVEYDEDLVIDFPDHNSTPQIEEQDEEMTDVEEYINNRSKEECMDPEADALAEKLIFEETGYDFRSAAKNSNRKYTDNQEPKKKNKKGIIKRVVAFALALVVGAGIYSCASRKSKEGAMTNSNLPQAITTTDVNTTAPDKKVGDNSKYNNYSYQELIDVTNNEHQKSTMNYIDATLINFNKTFADAYVETDKNVRAALSFEEVVSLQQAYSNYTPDQIKAYFNGTQTDATEMTRNYKNATLQLMGAYVIETRENAVDVSWLIDSQEGRDFYYRYHNALLEMKEATGTEQLMKINNFFNMVREDFPITNEVRTEGISHADAYKEIESYKLAVTPMIAAAEMIYQNLESDLTLDDSEINFINDLGLCDYASKKFEKIEMITMNSVEDKTNPTYEQYRKAITSDLKKNDIYVVDDARRDLSRLDSFQNAVNWHFEMVEGEFTGSISYGTTTTYETVEESLSKPIPANKKSEIDSQINEENANARRTGEANAQRTQQQRQAEEDENARRVSQEVAQDNANLQNQINNANNKINNNEQVNESDFDGNVVFDNNHKDSDGNLNDSVQNITTDPTGDMTNEPLPDPNAMGMNFDEGKTFSVESEPISEYEEEYLTDEELIDAYINTLTEVEYEGAYVYHK